MTQIPRPVAIALATMIVLIGGLSLYAWQQAGQSPLETVTPTVILPTEVVQTPTAAARATVEIPTTVTQFTGSRAQYALLLPPGWVIISPAEYGQRLAASQTTSEPQTLLAALDLMAYDAQMPAANATLTIAVAARNSLGLEGYLAAMAAELSAVGNVETRIERTLRADGLPTGILSYTTSGDLLGSPAKSIFTQQVVFIDNDGANFVIVTFAADADHAAQTQWREIVSSMTFS
ncbi:MAG: hypothetical protein KDE46_04180 [Caldilineaceae bacterium]|nr:hypothetical protein [Caldilineaceae bacterium]